MLHSSKRDSAINQVPITTKLLFDKYGTKLKLLAVTITLKKSRPISRTLSRMHFSSVKIYLPDGFARFYLSLFKSNDFFLAIPSVMPET